MWMMGMAIFGVIAGYIGGILLGQLLWTGGEALLGRPIWIPYPALLFAVVGALVGVVVARRRPEFRR